MSDFIKNLPRMKQVFSFEGMNRIGNQYPTDIDGLLDYGGKSFIYLEGKTEHNGMTGGQKIALENLVKSHIKAGHTACAILFEHNNSPDEVVVVRLKKVLSVFTGSKSYNCKWFDYSEECMRVMEVIERWEEKNCK